MISDKSYSLSTIMNRIKQVFEERMNEVYFWMKAELMHVKSDRNGHYYLDLVETKDGSILAKSTAQIWNYTATYLKEELATDFNQIIKPGSEIMCYCKAVFHTVYGLSFVITKVDINYNLGALERKKKAILEQLLKEGILEKNKQHKLPKVIQRIALVGSPNTSGYEDFLNQLKKNSYGYAYHVKTFPAKVQGDTAAIEIAEQLAKISYSDFDAVVLLRGGGSKFDLEAFNDYDLAKAIGCCPLPVITGIGHETDTSIADLTAHTSLKTPSAAGAFIVERTVEFENNIHLAYLNIKRIYDQKLQQLNKDLKHHITEFAALSKAQTRTERGNLHTLSNRIINLVNEEQVEAHSLLNKVVQQLNLLPNKKAQQALQLKNEQAEQLQLYSSYIIREARTPLKQKAEQLPYLTKMKLRATNSKLTEWEHYPSLYHPEVLLKKGYALVRKENEIIKPTTTLKKGDFIEIELYDRTINAKIEDTPTWKTLHTKKQNTN
ncbi:exodeoxyribonuclease VII large subunit [Paenimyroides ummariense]|uniref:Exodeoxyribonuclease 7 large subunit n=1 Tax=Paenimyroides ummariense TaxID=913024 RepID=A0A1I5CQG2_9FLAO|nr:exodeoxyribonuclease VII large subunit [Paenimyroides ummariense]SFN89240.1 exodeoxyribonuclease VII large subunit [Paenimyroides ummariense]